MSAKIPLSIMIVTTIVSCIILVANGERRASVHVEEHAQPADVLAVAR